MRTILLWLAIFFGVIALVAISVVTVLTVGPVLFPALTPTPTVTPTPIPGSISGTASWQLKNGGNIVLPGLVVSARCASCKYPVVGVTDSTGKYTITGLPPAPHIVMAYQQPSPSTSTLALVTEKCWHQAVAVFPATDTQFNLYYGNYVDPIFCQ